ncbi:glycine rich domain-containing protein [Segatella albensis]|uniref:glycine rich domain-containing protein n=2 Tax=Segatella albensis TaxID=77768 RepID=UPI000417E353|nr:glycine rich domain-containing protein [Segatella albensis]
MQTFTAPISTSYKIQCWGASGGNVGPNELGGGGGYSIGNKSLNESNNLYVCVGSQGNSNSSEGIGGSGGYNGGGKGGNAVQSIYSGGAGGGGATHIAILINRGELKNYEDSYLSELLLVAGGGGGGTAHCPKAGVGGGVNGGNGINSVSTYTITGATQTSGYAFGQGQDGVTKIQAHDKDAEGNGGGGGGFYGGPASQRTDKWSDCPGTGGSGYVGSVSNGITIAGDQTFASPSGGTETGHSGDGYAIISWISPSL